MAVVEKAWWKCDDANGTTLVDSSGNGHDGSGTYTPATGKIGGAADFNGSTDAIDCGVDIIGTAAVTICGWFYLDSFGEGGVSPYGYGRILDSGKLIFSSYNSSSHLLCAALSSNGGTTYAYSAGHFVLNTWYHWAVTRTAAGVVNFYRNGMLSGTADQTSGTPAAATVNLFMGNRSAGDRAYDGKIEDLRIFDSILTVGQIRRIWAQTAGTYNSLGQLYADSKTGLLKPLIR